MKTFCLSSDTRSSLLALIGQTATRIAADEWEVVIGFKEQTVICKLIDDEAASQNPHDEVIHARVEVHAGVRAPSEEMPEQPGRRLTGILVADAVVCFTDHETYGTPYQIGQGTRSLFSRIRAALLRTDTNRLKAVVERALVDATGGHEELTVLPTSDSWRGVDQRFVNHVETGVVFVFGDLCLPAFTPNNAFSMVCTREDPLQPIADVVNEHGDTCRFVELSMKPAVLDRDAANPRTD